MGEQPVSAPEPEPERYLAVVTVLPPYNESSIRFRDAVYSYPELVRVRLPRDHIAAVSELAPGAQFRVRSDGSESPAWTALLICGESSLFRVTEVSSRPADAG